MANLLHFVAHTNALRQLKGYREISLFTIDWHGLRLVSAYVRVD